MVSQLHSNGSVEEEDSNDQTYSISDLTIGTKDQKLNFEKYLNPIILPNQNHNQSYFKNLKNLKNKHEYIFVINWVYQFRAFLKPLGSESFDVDLFELELLNYFPDLNSKVLFINKLKLSILKFLEPTTKYELDDFEKIVYLWFRNLTPISFEEEYNDENMEEEEEIKEEGDEIKEEKLEIQQEDQQDFNPKNLPKFDYLLIEDKFKTLYVIINYISKNHKFRSWISNQSNNLPDFSRIDPIYSNIITKNNAPAREEYYLLFDNQRLYKRTIKYNEIKVPKTLKSSPQDPNEYYKPEQFDISQQNIKFELLYNNIFEFNEYLTKIKNNKALKPIYMKLYKSQIIENFFENEIKKRKFLISKKKEIQLANLLAVRKRSLRLREKEKT
ncbi:uncharacterized protein KGF55_002347 [Candida pseudojiufengensis]|uniref:uncharacterized protein n=1 Tax=Candida pseudojiufengensis TaxID=497109 RepID=UPI00222553AB|nr:uncharacterized protein KGF55_002347 [Candida pseudojiufengensis]KAI5963467.1 hypothetical protein KGF55_002347 [Candida pseudojiufengensis]